MEIYGYILIMIMGIILGLMGGGGSILTVPILVYCFNINPVSATSYSLFIVGITSLYAALRYRCQNILNVRLAIIFAIPSIIGVLISRLFLLPLLPDTWYIFQFTIEKNQFILLCFGVLVIVISGFMFLSKDSNTQTNDLVRDIKLPLGLIFIEGFFVGIITGFVGAGGGFMIVPALTLLAGVTLRTAIATSLLIIASKSLIGFLGDVLIGIEYNYVLLSIILIITLISVILGVKLSSLVSTKVLRRGFALIVLMMGILIVFKETYIFKNFKRSQMSLHTNVQRQNKITVTELYRLMEKDDELIIIDVREPEETLSGVIKNSTLIPLSSFEQKIPSIKKESIVILYCRSGRRSGIAQEILIEHGFVKTFNLIGGILKWNEFITNMKIVN